MLSDTFGIINTNLTRKNAKMLKPNQVLKLIAMIKPKNAPAKCSAKYKAINISFIEHLIIYVAFDVNS